MTAAAASTVQIGDQTFAVGRLSTFKVLRAGTLLAAILREVPELSDRMAEFQRTYAEQNTLRVSRAYAELRYDPDDLAKISNEAWEESGGKLEIPASPGAMEMAGHVLPYAWDAVPERLLELLALLVAPNSELRQAALDEDAIQDVLRSKRETLMFADADELLELLAAASDVIEEQFSGKAGALRRIGRLVGLARGEAMTPMPTEEPATTPTTPTEPSPSSDTDSDAPTDGASTNGSGDRSDSSTLSSTR